MYTTPKRSLESPETENRSIKKINMSGDQSKVSTLVSETALVTSQSTNLNVPITVDVATLRLVVSEVVSEELKKHLSATKKEINDSFEKTLDDRLSKFATSEQLEGVEQQLVAMEKECKLQCEANKQLLERIAALEKISKDKNLIFSNVTISTNPMQLVRDICRGNLGVENVNILKVIKLKEDKTKNSSTLLAVFNEEATVNMLLRKARGLKDSGIGLSRDLTTEGRATKNILLKIRREIFKKDTSNHIVKVFNNKLIIDNVTLILTNDYFGNKNSNIDGREYLKNTFNIDFDLVKNSMTNPQQ